jgi:3-deoxy-manno-octulosonate cytidylyltransferase (CMP-KDO synthetase)|tara:strand:+ start:2129 stop:2866 length:738 start_codon:yes stop_codon:yes gene_type:complete
MNVVIIIPARYGSSRYEGKPLIMINKIPLIIRVVKKCVLALDRDNVYVATDDKRIADLVKGYGYKFIMTSKNNLTGTDRVAEASTKIKADIFINVQGDEPLIKPSDIIKVINYKKKEKNYIICAYCKLQSDENENRRTIPKVVFNEKNELLYISRNSIPVSKKNNVRINYFKQVCIYAFTKNELKEFKSFNRKSFLENIEDIEILRFFELNKKIKMVKVSNSAVAVDEPSDRKKVEQILNEKKKN